MPISPKYQVDFIEGAIYHVYNRTNNKELLFKSDDNRLFFLKQYERYLGFYVQTFCWCLLDNHFHFLVRIKSLDEIRKSLQQKKLELRTTTENRFLNEDCELSELVEVAFKNFFQSYTLAYNKQQGRKGNLLYKPFKRIRIDRDTQLTQVVIYIHANPLKHSLHETFESYKWSSYQSYLSDAPSKILRKELLEWFGSRDVFVESHKKMANYYYADVAIED